MDQVADRLEASLRAVGTPKRAEGEKPYLKSELDFTGTLVSQTRAEVKRLDAELALDHDGVLALAEALWSKPVFERRLAAIMFLQRHARLVTVKDLPVLERFVRDSRTWALVDYLAVDVLGRMVGTTRAPSPRTDRWAADDDFWIRRSSLLCELRPIRSGEPLLGSWRGPTRCSRSGSSSSARPSAGCFARRESGGRTTCRLARPAHASRQRRHDARGGEVPAAGDAERLMQAYRERRPA